MTNNTATAKCFIERLKTYQSAAEREKTLRYFKTPANGEADQFIGVRMGQVFTLAKEFITMTPVEIEKLLESKIASSNKDVVDDAFTCIACQRWSAGVSRRCKAINMLLLRSISSRIS